MEFAQNAQVVKEFSLKKKKNKFSLKHYLSYMLRRM